MQYQPKYFSLPLDVGCFHNILYVGFISGTILGRMWNRSTPLSEIMIEIWQSTWDKVKGSKGKAYKKCKNEKCKELFFLFVQGENQ